MHVPALLVASGVAAGCLACSTGDSATAGNGPPGTYSVCGALTAACNEFYGGMAEAENSVVGVPTACIQTAAARCSTHVSDFSDAFQSAVVACAKTYSPCAEPFVVCVATHTASATPTAAQAKVKADFCATYGPSDGGTSLGESLCADFFAATPVDAGPYDEDISYGLGYLVLVANDALATKMDACIHTAQVLDLQGCMGSILLDAVDPGCPGDGGGADR